MVLVWVLPRDLHTRIPRGEAEGAGAGAGSSAAGRVRPHHVAEEKIIAAKGIGSQGWGIFKRFFGGFRNKLHKK